MHDGQGGLVGLSDVLALVPHNDWLWSILDFDGIGRVPGGLDHHEFVEPSSGLAAALRARHDRELGKV